MDHAAEALNLILQTSTDFDIDNNHIIIQVAQIHALHALLDIADAIRTKPPAAPSPDWPRWRNLEASGETKTGQITCACGDTEWTRYPTRYPTAPPPLNWWACSNPACFRVMDLDATMESGSPSYAYEPGNQY
jgi:hypothetical protein